MAKGNRTPRERKPDDQKSKLKQFRLHPENADHAWALERIEHYQKDGITVRELFLQGLEALEGNELPLRTIDVSGRDVAIIHQALEYIMDKLESGVIASPSKGSSKRRKDVVLPDAIKSTIDRYIGGGLVLDED